MQILTLIAGALLLAPILAHSSGGTTCETLWQNQKLQIHLWQGRVPGNPLLDGVEIQIGREKVKIKENQIVGYWNIPLLIQAIDSGAEELIFEFRHYGDGDPRNFLKLSPSKLGFNQGNLGSTGNVVIRTPVLCTLG